MVVDGDTNQGIIQGSNRFGQKRAKRERNSFAVGFAQVGQVLLSERINNSERFLSERWLGKRERERERNVEGGNLHLSGKKW